ncbi:MAG: tail fiber domain-containing protein [Verrucomicrobiota bacterium]
MAVNGINFDGNGQFKFALVNGGPAGAVTTFWSNDGSSVSGNEPSAAVSLTVTKGLYAVLLGDPALVNMTAVPPSVFDHDTVLLRVWFNDGVHGFQHLEPDQRLAAAGYALVAEKVSQVLLADVLAPPLKPVAAWGDNARGQLAVPAPLADVAAIAAGDAFSLALLKNGTVLAWGDNTGSQTTPPPGLAQVTAIAAGSAHGLALESGGTVTAWGGNSAGQTAVPGGLANVTAIAAGLNHSLALRADGTVSVWGDHTFGQLNVPPGLANVTAIAAGADHCLVLKADGTVAAWGRNEAGQTTVPAGLSGVKAIAAGAFHSLALKNDGTVTAWGWNDAGQCGVPAGLTGVTKIAAGYAFSLALKSDGTVTVWGDNSKSQLTPPAGLSRITSIAAGARHALALRADLIPAAVARLDQSNVFTENLGIRRVPAANALEVEGTVSKTTAGNWAANSDRRIKEGIRTVTGALETLDKVRLVDFRYTDSYRAAHPGLEDKRHLNVIAQEFAEIFPDHVRGSGEKLPDGSEILQVDTYPLTIYSAAAIQELHHENQELKARLAAQEERLRKLETALGAPR